MYQFSIASYGNMLSIECYNAKANAMYSIYSSVDRPLVLRLYQSLQAADGDQVKEIMHGWSGCHNALELRRIEDILNQKKNLFYEPKTNTVLNIKDLYKAYKHGYFSFPWADYIARRIKNNTLQDRIPLVPEGGRRAYVAQFV